MCLNGKIVLVKIILSWCFSAQQSLFKKHFPNYLTKSPANILSYEKSHLKSIHPLLHQNKNYFCFEILLVILILQRVIGSSPAYTGLDYSACTLLGFSEVNVQFLPSFLIRAYKTMLRALRISKATCSFCSLFKIIWQFFCKTSNREPET